jgi:hypothetical protein
MGDVRAVPRQSQCNLIWVLAAAFMKQKIAIVFIGLLLGACADVPQSSNPRPCDVTVFQDGNHVVGVTPPNGVTTFTLQNRPFTLKVAKLECKPSLGTFSSFERMRSLGSQNSKLFTTTGFEMAGDPTNLHILPAPRDAERIAATDLGDMFGDIGTKHFNEICKRDGKCPIPVMAFRSYWNFSKDKEGTPNKEATLDPTAPRGSALPRKPISLMVYTENERFLRPQAIGNWPAEIVLEAHPLLLVFKN